MTNTGTSALTAAHDLMAAIIAKHGLTTEQAAAYVFDLMASERPELLVKIAAGMAA